MFCASSFRQMTINDCLNMIVRFYARRLTISNSSWFAGWGYVLKMASACKTTTVLLSDPVKHGLIFTHTQLIGSSLALFVLLQTLCLASPGVAQELFTIKLSDKLWHNEQRE